MGEIFAGRYELIDALGEGGVGVVWRAWDHREKRYVAAKVLRQVDAASLLRFVREQSYRIEHDHVVMPLGWAGEDDRVLFTMPLVRGGSVATLLGDYGALSASWTAALLDQLLAALSAIHAIGLVHRDVKPANLLLEPTGTGRPQLRLSDFGIAAAVGSPRLTTTDIVLGTPGYQAPEARDGADPDPRQDLYSVGMTAIEMLTGTAPDHDADPAELFASLDAPEPLSSLVVQLASVGATDRPATAVRARELLRATGLVPDDDATPASDDVEIEIFDHLPDLPEHWAPAVIEPPGRRSNPVPAPVPAPPSQQPVADTTTSTAVDHLITDAPTQPRSRALLFGSVGAVLIGLALIVASIVLLV